MMRMLLGRRRCTTGHTWFPGGAQREFIPLTDTCLRCNQTRTLLPWGRCLCGQRLADHYDDTGTPVPVPGCTGAR